MYMHKAGQLFSITDEIASFEFLFSGYTCINCPFIV